jgi:hypothetical protein
MHYMDTAASNAWAVVTAKAVLSADELRDKYGLRWVRSGSSREHTFASHDSELRFQLRDKQIAVRVLKNGVPEGQLPKERISVVEGDPDHPLPRQNSDRPQNQ